MKESTEGKNPGTLNLTHEQTAIIHSVGDIKINAVAGSGKTTTIIKYAAGRPKDSKILYLAFNKTVKLEAIKRFSQIGMTNVQVETAHSLAYKHIVPKKGYKVCQTNYKTYEIAEKLGLTGMGEKHGEYILANHISKFLTYFCNSTAVKVQDLNYRDIVSDELAKAFVNNFYRQIEQGTRLLLRKMYDGELEITHDFYLKMFQLSNPVLAYDYILFDEGQDASPAMLDIFLKQKATKVIVGDTHQQIYAWRHAVNSLQKVNFAGYTLSTSFRFCHDIAKLAMEILSWKRHLQEVQPVTITGLGKPSHTKSKATLARTNLGLLIKAIKYITEHWDARYLYFEGNINSYTYADEGASLYDVLNLYNGKRDRIRDKLIKSMSNLEDLQEYIEKTEDIQLSMMVDIVREYGNEIPSLIQSLKRKHVADEEKEKAEMIFSTVHRSKGMEYDEVYLAEDFVTESKLEKLKSEKKENENINPAKWNEEINLLYVAITRTKGILHIPEAMLPKNFPDSPNICIITRKERVSIDNSKFFPVAPDYARKTFYPKQKTNRGFSKRINKNMNKNTFMRWTPEKDAELKEMYYKGIKLTSIAEHFNLYEGTILSRLKKIGCVNFD